MAKKEKEESLWERAKKRAGEEIDMLKNKPSAFANAENADKNIAYDKKKRKKSSE
jgi:hypothetical protein